MTDSGQSDVAARMPPEDRALEIRRGDLECLLDRVVYAPTWTPDRIEDLDPTLLEAIAAARRALEAIG